MYLLLFSRSNKFLNIFKNALYFFLNFKLWKEIITLTGYESNILFTNHILFKSKKKVQFLKSIKFREEMKNFYWYFN